MLFDTLPQQIYLYNSNSVLMDIWVIQHTLQCFFICIVGISPNVYLPMMWAHNIPLEFLYSTKVNCSMLWPEIFELLAQISKCHCIQLNHTGSLWDLSYDKLHISSPQSTSYLHTHILDEWHVLLETHLSQSLTRDKILISALISTQSHHSTDPMYCVPHG